VSPKSVSYSLFSRPSLNFSLLIMDFPSHSAALASVDIKTIQRWVSQMIWWIEAYRSALGAKDPQFQVKAFSSKHYKSHRRVLARQSDA
jgi:hypothetical protein